MKHLCKPIDIVCPSSTAWQKRSFFGCMNSGTDEKLHNEIAKCFDLRMKDVCLDAEEEVSVTAAVAIVLLVRRGSSMN